MSDSVLRSALAVSAALHALLGMWVEVRDASHPPVEHEIRDVWAGRGIEVDSVPLADAAAVAATTAAPGPELAPQREPEPAAKQPEPPRRHASAAKHETSHPSALTAAAAAATAAAPANTAVAGSGTAEPGADSANGTPAPAFGAAALPTGVRHLPKAFTRALSIADRGDPRWLTLPAGPAGEVRIELPVDEDGKLGELAYPDENARDKLAPVVRHLLENTRLLLESGHFSLDPANLRAGVERLRVRVEVVERPATSDPDADPNELEELEYEPPARGKPGRGSFALNSGRRVIGWVYLE